MKPLLLFLLSCFSLHNIVRAQSVDSSFGTNGLVLTKPGTNADEIDDMTVQPDGKTVAGGISNAKGTKADIVLTRYNANGSLDLSFGDNGIVRTDLGKTNDYFWELEQQSDGKTVVLAKSMQGDTLMYVLLRYMQDGKRDFTFGTNGYVNINMYTTALSLQNDKIIVGGGSNVGSSRVCTVKRYTVNGKTDATFGINGARQITIGKAASFYDEALAVAPDGSIFMTSGAGGVTDASDLMLLKLTKGGRIDSSFNGKGFVLSNWGNSEQASAIALQPNGQIVIGGHSHSDVIFSELDDDYILARYNANGTLDSSFGTRGEVLTDFLSTAGVPMQDVISSIQVLPDNKILAAGITIPNNGNLQGFISMAEYNTDGSLYKSFGNKGIVLTRFEPGIDSRIYTTAMQADGKILLGGSSGKYFALLRMNLSKSPLAEAATSSLVNKSISSLSAVAISLAPNPVQNNLVVRNLPAGKNQLSIVDAAGVLVSKTKTSSAVYNWNVSGLPKGMYFLVIQSGGKRQMIKFVKE